MHVPVMLTVAKSKGPSPILKAPNANILHELRPAAAVLVRTVSFFLKMALVFFPFIASHGMMTLRAFQFIYLYEKMEILDLREAAE